MDNYFYIYTSSGKFYLIISNKYKFKFNTLNDLPVDFISGNALKEYIEINYRGINRYMFIHNKYGFFLKLEFYDDWHGDPEIRLIPFVNE